MKPPIATPQEIASRCQSGAEVVRAGGILGRGHEHRLAALMQHAERDTLHYGNSLAERIAAETTNFEKHLQALIARLGELK
jgi:hypothetical protein